MPRVMKRTLLFAMLGFFADACQSSTGTTSPANIAGAWTFNSNYSNSALAASCTAVGIGVTVSEAGSNFTGAVVSGSQIGTVAGQAQTTALAGEAFSGGQIRGSSVTFTSSGGGTFNGTMSGNPPNSMGGTETRSIAVNGQAYVFAGTWTASR